IADAWTAVFGNDHDGSCASLNGLIVGDRYFALHFDRGGHAEVLEVVFPPCLYFGFSEKRGVIGWHDNRVVCEEGNKEINVASQESVQNPLLSVFVEILTHGFCLAFFCIIRDK